MAGPHCKATLILGAVMMLAGCATKPAPKPVAAAAQPPAGAIAGRAPLGSGTGATGVVDETYLYDQHQKARQLPTHKPASGSTTTTLQPPWSAAP